MQLCNQYGSLTNLCDKKARNKLEIYNKQSPLQSSLIYFNNILKNHNFNTVIRQSREKS